MHLKRFSLAVVALLAVCVSACTQVHPGNVGVRVNNIGGDRGVDPNPLGVGWYFTGFGTQIFEYPAYSKTYTFTANEHEGNAVNEEFTFQDKNGLVLTASIGVQFSADAKMAPLLYQKFRVTQEQIVAGALRNAIRDTLITEAANLDVNDINGAKKAWLMTDVQNRVAAYFKPYGLSVEKLFWASKLGMPDNVQGQINNRIANEQEALAEQAKVATIQAKAQQAVAEAEGVAKAMDIRGEALKRNPNLLAYDKWDGHLPLATGGGTPLINLGELGRK